MYGLTILSVIFKLQLTRVLAL